SGLSLSSDAFIEHLFRLLERYRHLTHHLIIEMTEGVALQNLERTHNVIRRIQEHGVRIGLDDFGAGYTSFSYLRNLKADVIKIDGTLIQNMLADPNNIAIVRTIIQLAHQLKMACIAEWVEDEATLQALRKLGVDYLQGFFISPAVPLETVLKSQNIFDFLTTEESRNCIRQLIAKP
ncbi:MAG TPA: EAL domain-containing protein, partial [Burkholderiaceae bacterium]|nr:EAL domain-containing protein [Burkholderiaceae bacterium]